MIKHLVKITIGTIAFIFGFSATAQLEDGRINDTSGVNQYENFLRIVESTLEDYYRDYSSTDKQTDSIISAFGHDYDFVPQFSDSVYCSRLNEMSNLSPFKLSCNEDVLKTIKFFAENRRNFTSVVLGRSKLYFNMFEEKLAKHNLPIELKYLAVIESGLQPQVKSRAGALGLWQFMYRTGKLMGLNQNSYIDDRMDPRLSTEAACRYLKQLHDLYKDWNVALAAYNAGPGNVNKAIRRSGGKMTYWEIRPFLPRETQGYVPNFIAMSYLMTYHAEHNIREREAKFNDFEIDTVCLRNGLQMATIDSLINWSVEDIKILNPVYKTSYIPKTLSHSCIQIPTSYLNQWIAMEDSIYKLDSAIYQIPIQKVSVDQSTPLVHYVRRGQTLGHIANQHNTTVKKIMEWNNLRSTRLSIGQKLLLYSKENTAISKDAVKPKAKEKPDNSVVSNTTSGNKIIHTINQGDSLWIIARRNETTVDELKRLNPGVDYMDLKVGQEIRIK